MPPDDMPDGKLSTGQLDVLNDKPIAADSDQDSLDDDVYHDLATGPIVKKPVTSTLSKVRVRTCRTGSDPGPTPIGPVQVQQNSGPDRPHRSGSSRGVDREPGPDRVDLGIHQGLFDDRVQGQVEYR